MRLPHRTEWLLVHKPHRIQRSSEPVVFDLEQAVGWIKEEKPIIWLGSIFSVPEPSGLPSGYALTRSLLELVFNEEAIAKHNRDQVIETVLPHWPLEALFDEFEWLDFDLSESLLTFFEGLNKSVEPSPLHKGITSYYQTGFASRPLCITTNWDTLQEQAFRAAGYAVVIGGPGEMPGAAFGKESGDSKTIFVYHPHGSFETKDVVCSLKREQSQLALSFEMMSYPTLFLGYSGYEPSLYRKLEFAAGQLWCIRDRKDLEIPAKRRLLTKPNTFVYLGDMRELLQALGVLNEKIDLTSKYLALDGKIPPKVVEIVRLSIFAALSPEFCVSVLAETLMSFHDEPEATFRFVSLMRAAINHVRNRDPHPGLLLSLLAAARFRDSEQTWITVLAHLLRMNNDLPSKIIKEVIRLAEGVAAKAGDPGSFEDQCIYMPGVLLNRTKLYKSFLGVGEKIVDEKEYLVPALSGSDMAAEGENIELLAFEHLSQGNKHEAETCFDYAATSFYLRGLWNAGRLNEWAANNIEEMMKIVKSNNTLMIPHTST